MSRNLCNVSRFDRHIFTLNLTIERKTLEHATWCPFVVHTQYISLVSIPWLHQCTHAWSTPRSAPRSACRTKRHSRRQTTLITYILLICLTQCLGTTDWNLIRPPPNFRRFCKISKSGKAAKGCVFMFLSVCLSVCLYGTTETSWNFVLGSSPKTCREEWVWWQRSKKYTSRGDLHALTTTLLTNVATVTFDINRY